MLPVRKSFSRPPMRCSRPGVPGMTQGARQVLVAGVGLEAFGLGAELDLELGQIAPPRESATARRRCRGSRRRAGSPASCTSRRCGRLRGRSRSSRRANGRRAPASGTRRCGRTTACSRSDCSVLVGRPVEGPPRWTLTITSGSSSMTARPSASRLQRHAGAGGGGQAERAAIGGADGRADAGDLVLGLEGRDVEVLECRQVVQDVGGRRDRIGTEEQRHARELRGGDEAQRGGLVAGDAAVLARAVASDARI